MHVQTEPNLGQWVNYCEKSQCFTELNVKLFNFNHELGTESVAEDEL